MSTYYHRRYFFCVIPWSIWVWHACKERFTFWTPGYVPLFVTCLCSNSWDQIPRTCHVFTRHFTLNTPRYFLDFAWITTRNFDSIGIIHHIKFQFRCRKCTQLYKKAYKIDLLDVYSMYMPQIIRIPSNNDYNIRLFVYNLFSFWSSDQKQMYMFEEIKIPAYTDLLVSKCFFWIRSWSRVV